MKRKSLSDAECPIAKTLDCVGEWWSLLIIRDAMHGLKRFDEFLKSLDIAPNMLTRRLTDLVEGGLLEKSPYSSRPPRYEYHLTEKGRALRPVLVAMLAWGNQFLAHDTVSVQLADRDTGEIADPIVVDRKTGKEITAVTHQIIPGPGASPAMHTRINLIQAHQNQIRASDILKKEAKHA